MMAVLLDMPFDISLPSEARCRLRTEFVHAPERARDPDDARAVLETLHADPRRVERGADRHGPVVRQQPRLMPRQVRLQPVALLPPPPRPLGHPGDIPALHA